MFVKHGKTFISFLVILLFPTVAFFSVTKGAGSISGYIFEEESSEPIMGMDIDIFDGDWTLCDVQPWSDYTGYYIAEGLAPGTYYVRAQAHYPQHYRNEYWNNAFTKSAALPVTVEADEAVTDINIRMELGAYLGGIVREISTEKPLSDVDLDAFDENWNKVDANAGTDSDGIFYLGGLPSGTYYLMADFEYPQYWVDQYYDHSSGPLHALPITLTVPYDRLNLVFDASPGGYITGSVNGGGTASPVSGIEMHAYNGQMQKMRLEAKTDAEGDYILGAYEPGTYFVKANPRYPEPYLDQYYDGVYYPDQATPLSVSSYQDRADINFTLEPGNYILGTVVDSTNESVIPEIKVKGYDPAWRELPNVQDWTNEDGLYVIGAFSAGSYYVKAVPVYPQPYIDEYYDDTLEREEAVTVEVTPDSPVTGIDFALDRGSYMLGKISDEQSGLGISDVDVDIWDQDWEWVPLDTKTNSSGDYIFGAMSAGDYYIQADPANASGYICEFWDDSFFKNAADLINVTLEQDTTGIDFELKIGGQFRGEITNAFSGNPVENIPVRVFDPQWNDLPVNLSFSDHDGSYLSPGLPDGYYYVKAEPESGQPYEEQYYPFSDDRENAETVSVTEQSMLQDIDFSLIPTGEPTPTPTLSLGVELDISKNLFQPSDTFYLNAILKNPGALMTRVPLFVVLEVYEHYWFWPAWKYFHPPESSQIDFDYVNVETGVNSVTVIEPFPWPQDAGGPAYELHFFGAMLNSDFSEPLGDIGSVEWGYEP